MGATRERKMYVYAKDPRRFVSSIECEDDRNKAKHVPVVQDPESSPER